jgi:hypothetical protein
MYVSIFLLLEKKENPRVLIFVLKCIKKINKLAIASTQLICWRESHFPAQYARLLCVCVCVVFTRVHTCRSALAMTKPTPWRAHSRHRGGVCLQQRRAGQVRHLRPRLPDHVPAHLRRNCRRCGPGRCTERVRTR